MTASSRTPRRPRGCSAARSRRTSTCCSSPRSRTPTSLARFAKKIGGDVKRAQTSYGEREFVSADTDGRARIEKRTLVITGTELDDTVLLREGRRLAIDFKADGVVDFEPSQRRFDRIRFEGGDGERHPRVRRHQVRRRAST